MNYHDDPLQYHIMEDILGMEPELHLVHEDNEPCSFTKANGQAAWRTTMEEEMDVVEKNKTWELAVLPVNHHAITLK